MKLSEAILIGSKLAPPARSVFANSSSGVCLMGAAALATGLTIEQMQEAQRVNDECGVIWDHLFKEFPYAFRAKCDYIHASVSLLMRITAEKKRENSWRKNWRRLVF